jgi:hypothetical protein
MQHAYTVHEGPHNAREKSGVARTDLAALLGFANGFLEDCENRAALGHCAVAGLEQLAEHDLEMGGMFLGETEIGDAHGVHLRRKTGSAFLGRFHNLYEFDESGLAGGG